MYVYFVSGNDRFRCVLGSSLFPHGGQDMLGRILLFIKGPLTLQENKHTMGRARIMTQTHARMHNHTHMHVHSHVSQRMN